MNGVLLINKEKGYTSRDVINKLNKLLGTKKIGHTGTLDPLATGILVVCIGKYTKLVPMLSSLKKEYVAEIKLGIKTDTLDITGNILEEISFNVSEEKIKEVFKNLIGVQKQVVPIYSAKKVNGKKLYEYARNNETVKLPETEIEIYNLDLLSFKNDIITFKTLVSKGTYIRSLIEEICKRLYTIGTMNNLTRTIQGDFTLEDCFTLKNIADGKFKMLSTLDLFDFEVIKLNNEEYKKVKNGSKVKFNSEDKYLILTYEDKEIAIYEKDNDIYRVKVML